MTNSPVRIGLVGAGFRLRSVVQLLLGEAKGRVEVAASYDPDAGAQTAVQKEFGDSVTLCASEDELTERPDIQWVFIGSFNCHHARQAIKALRAGKHVFCEKPLATTFEDCLQVRQAVRETGRMFSFGLSLRYSPFYRKIKELLEAGTIGELISFEFNETLGFNHGGYIFGNWRRRTEFAGTHLLEKCCHDLDLANWLTGRLPVRAASFGSRNFFKPGNERHALRIGPDNSGKAAYRTWADPHGVDPFSPGADIVDNQVAILEYAGGIHATFHTNCNTGLLERRFFLCGTEGTLRANAYTGTIEYARIAHEPEVVRIDSLAKGSHAGGDSVLGRQLAATLLDGAPPLATIDDALRACIVAFGIDAAMQEGKVTDFASYWAEAGEEAVAPRG